LEAALRNELTLGQARALHEITAACFETYVLTGKAPNSALEEVFSRMKAWLSEVYHSVKEICGVTAPESVTQVFDRMLAGEGRIYTTPDKEIGGNAMSANEEMSVEQEMQLYENRELKAGQLAYRAEQHLNDYDLMIAREHGLYDSLRPNDIHSPGYYDGPRSHTPDEAQKIIESLRFATHESNELEQAKKGWLDAVQAYEAFKYPDRQEAVLDVGEDVEVAAQEAKETLLTINADDDIYYHPTKEDLAEIERIEAWEKEFERERGQSFDPGYQTPVSDDDLPAFVEWEEKQLEAMSRMKLSQFAL
jgi:hypothetical protein